MADIYLATIDEVSTGTSPKYVILKIARSDGEYREFYRNVIDNEANRLRQLRHPGVVRLLAVKTSGAQMNAVPYVGNADLPGRPPFMVMEYLSGGSLEDLLQTKELLSLGLVLDIGIKISLALDYTHRHNIVHLDVKPDNILFRYLLKQGKKIEPVLIDFGIARDTGQGGLEARTIHYAAPERLSTSNPEVIPPPHPSMDIWALGVVLYRMVTGKRPFDERTHMSLTSAILNMEPIDPDQFRKDTPPELSKLILRTLSKSPKDRPTAHEIALSLEEIGINQNLALDAPLEDLVGSSLEDSRLQPEEQFRGVRWLLVGGITVILFITLLIGSAWWGTDYLSVWPFPLREDLTQQLHILGWLNIVFGVLIVTVLGLIIYILSNRERRSRVVEMGNLAAQPFVRERPGKPRYKLILVDNAGVHGVPELIPIQENRVVIIGRDPDMVNVALNDQRVSRLHCRITSDVSGGFRVWDEGSVSGTYVNDADVPQQGMLLQSGDILAIGPIEYRFEINPQEDDTKSSVEPVLRA